MNKEVGAQKVWLLRHMVRAWCAFAPRRWRTHSCPGMNGTTTAETLAAQGVSRAPGVTATTTTFLDALPALNDYDYD